MNSMFSFFLTLSSLVIVLISSSLSLLEYLDTTVLTKDGSIPKDTDIDEFINE